MQATRYKVVCGKCQGSSTATIIDNQSVAWEKVDKVISARKRLDDNWGWQCLCGNNDLMTTQEKKQITDYKDPDPMEIAQVVKNLVPEKPTFKMVAV